MESMILKNRFIFTVLNEKGEPGYDVITPFKTVGLENILINRGWIKLSKKMKIELTK